MESTPQRSFVRTILPWLVAALMLLVYLVTLDKVVTIQSIYPLARASGMDWHPAYTSPVSWLVTLPIRWLPTGAQLIGLNFIGAICGALSLALLARGVSLLPHDRTQLQRDKLSADDSFLNIRLGWVPVLFAVLVCGFQRTFWEHAIIGTGEMLDLLLFAYCVRCVLEYRVDEKNSWLNKLALVYGLGITNNFAMIAFFPALLVALVWIKGWRFFRFDFLARMFLFGLAGLSLYLLLPIVQMQSDVQSVTFWQALKGNLAFQKQYLFTYPRWRAGWIGIYALLPLLLAGIRWPSSFGDTSPVGSAFTNVFGVILHAGLLTFSLYIAFDPPASPRQFGLGLGFLPAYFLAALSVGYYSGFLLLVFNENSGKSRRGFPLPPIVNYAVAGAVVAAAIFVTARLVAQNGPKIREATLPSLHDYAGALAKSLPENSAVVLSDDPVRLYAVSAALGHAATATHLLIETASLTNVSYHTALHNRYGDRWPKLALEPGYSFFTSQQILQLLSDLGQKHELIYLHPSFGFYLEKFYLEPRDYVYSLKPYSDDAAPAPVPNAALIARQTAAWNTLAKGPFKELKARITALPEDPAQRAAQGLIYVGACYSRALDWWGVELHRADRFDEAASFFEEAAALNPDNAAALINQEVNAAWRKERKRIGKLSENAEKKILLYPGVEPLLITCGPVDQPEFLMEIAQIFVRNNLFRQAGQMVDRALAFAPEELAYQTAKANLLLFTKAPERALVQITSVKPRAGKADPLTQIEIARVEAFAQYDLGNFRAAEKTLLNAITNFPAQDANYNALSQLYVIYSGKLRAEGKVAEAGQQLTNALKVIDGQRKAQPQNPSAHFNYGNLLIFVNDYAGAAEAFTKVLELQKDNSAALLNRAIAYLQSKKFDEAQADYQELLSRFTTTS
ncbi:MAG TPA: tetratricopeptide repeat protein, partial [Verrucomicrobiae bacterium]